MYRPGSWNSARGLVKTPQQQRSLPSELTTCGNYSRDESEDDEEQEVDESIDRCEV